MTIDDIHKNIVKVNEGSGIIIKLNNKHYVITAYHNVEESVAHEESIEIYNDRNIKLHINKCYYEKNKDIAMFHIDFINDISIIKADRHIEADDRITFMGYPDKNKGERVRQRGFVDEWNNKNSIKIEDLRSPGAEERVIEVVIGFSGSAVFKTNNNEPSLIGLLKSVPQKDFYYNELRCIPISDIFHFLEENNLPLPNILKEKKNTMKTKNKISNRPVLNFGENNNSPINTGSGVINVNYANNKPEASIDDAKKLFHSMRYNKAKKIFSDLMLDNDECKILYVLCSLSDKNIYEIRKNEIARLYKLVENIKDRQYLKIANYLWLIIFYEYSNAHFIPKKLDDQHIERRFIATRNHLKKEELELCSNINTVTIESDFIKFRTV